MSGHTHTEQLEGSAICSSCVRDFEIRRVATTKILEFQKRFPDCCWDFRIGQALQNFERYFEIRRVQRRFQNFKRDFQISAGILGLHKHFKMSITVIIIYNIRVKI